MSTIPTSLKKVFQKLGSDWFPINTSIPFLSNLLHSGFKSIPIILELAEKKLLHISNEPPLCIPISTRVTS